MSLTFIKSVAVVILAFSASCLGRPIKTKILVLDNGNGDGMGRTTLVTREYSNQEVLNSTAETNEHSNTTENSFHRKLKIYNTTNSSLLEDADTTLPKIFISGTTPDLFFQDVVVNSVYLVSNETSNQTTNGEKIDAKETNAKEKDDKEKNDNEKDDSGYSYTTILLMASPILFLSFCFVLGMLVAMWNDLNIMIKISTELDCSKKGCQI